MMRLFYNVLVFVGLPLAAVYWGWRALLDPSFRGRWYQRFGFGYPKHDTSTRQIWIHAVSVGEVQAAAPLVRALRDAVPDARVLITTVTPTGGDRVRLLFKDGVDHAYAPYDIRPAVRRFYDLVRPDLAIIIETELWPNLYHAAGVRGIPLVLASARISPRSMPRYRRLVGLFRDALSNGIIIAAQSEVDRQRFVELGAPEGRTFVSGNIKFDHQLDEGVAQAGAELRDSSFSGRPVWVAASTHAGEEEVLVDAHLRLRERWPDALLVLIPRHPGRFDDAAGLLDERRVSYVRRTDAVPVPAEASVLLGDTMGEVNLFYAAGDVAFVGGSLVPVGGHNLLEPAALSLPILVGPHLFNSEDIAGMFTECGAAEVVTDATEIVNAVDSLFRREQLRETMGGKARALISDNRGAVGRLLERLEPLLDQSATPAA